MSDLASRRLDRGLPRPFDMRSPALIRRQEEAVRRDAKKKRQDTSCLHVAISGGTAGALRDMAEDRDECPQVLAMALLKRVLDEGIADELMGEMRAEKAADGQGRRPFGQHGHLTLNQCGVVYQIGVHGGMRGSGPGCRLSETALAALIDASRQTVCGVISSLVARGVIVSTRPSIREDRVRRLTAIGQAIFEVLAGEVDD